MRVLISVHGIGTKGEWQDRIGDLLGSHFQYCAIKYPQYRRFGALKLVLDPVMIAVAAGVVAAAVALGYRPNLVQAASIVLLALGGAHAGAHLLREQALRDFKRKFDEAARGGTRPHVIAHSFGTYLTAAALRRYPDLRLHSVIFAGSVLSTRYDWGRLIANNRPFQLRNEIARRDYVSRLAYLLHGLVPGMGHSGFSGFSGAHELSDPYCSCSLCRTEPRFIHNVKNPELGHSDYVFSVGYAERFWLPFLWGIDAEAYSSFLSGCERLLELQEQGARGELRKELSAFRSSSWIRPGCTIGEYIAGELEERLSDCPWLRASMDELIVPAIYGVCRTVSDAQAELRKGKGRNATLVRSLHPVHAVTKALENVLQDFQCRKSATAHNLG